MNAPFVSPPEAFRPEAIRARWERMGHPERRRLVRSVGPRAAVREFGLPSVEVALAWRSSMGLEAKLVHVKWLATA